MTDQGNTRRWVLAIGGWLASDEEVFGDQNPLIPQASHLQAHATSRLGAFVYVGAPTADPDLDVYIRASEVTKKDFAPARRYAVVADAAILPERLLRVPSHSGPAASSGMRR